MQPGKPRSKSSDGAAALVTKLMGKNHDASVESARLIKASQLLSVSHHLDEVNQRESLDMQDNILCDPVTQKKQIDQMVKSSTNLKSIVESQMRTISKLSKAVERLEKKQRNLDSMSRIDRPGTAGPSITRSRSEAIMLESGLQLTGSPERESSLNPGMEFQTTVGPDGLRNTTVPKSSALGKISAIGTAPSP